MSTPVRPSGSEPRLEVIPVGSLLAFTRTFFERASSLPADRAGTAPITPERAASLAANPRALPDDPAVAVAWDGERCVGYQQVFPGDLVIPSEPSAARARVFWLCGGFVLPEMRQRGVFGGLVQSLIACGGEIASTAYSPGVDRALRRLGFQEFGPLRFGVTYLRKVHLGRRLGGLFADRGDFRAWAARRLERAARSFADPTLRIRSTSRITPIASELPAARLITPRFDRPPELVDWMLSHPWVRENAPPVRPEFHFSDRRQRFQYHVQEIRSETGAARGYFVASHQAGPSGSRWTMLDHAFAEPAMLGTALHWQWRRIAELGGVDEVILPGSAWTLLQGSRWFRALSFLHTRPYLGRPISTSSPLARAMPSMDLQFVDCDSAFC